MVEVLGAVQSLIDFTSMTGTEVAPPLTLTVSNGMVMSSSWS